MTSEGNRALLPVDVDRPPPLQRGLMNFQLQNFQPYNKSLVSRETVDFVSLETQCFRACLHEDGGPQVGEVTCAGLPHLTCKRDYVKMRDYMDRWINPPKRLTSPTWGPPPPCRQALSH